MSWFKRGLRETGDRSHGHGWLLSDFRTGSGSLFYMGFSITRILPAAALALMGRSGRLNLWEVADHKKQVHQPEREPDGSDGNEPNREEHQTWL